MQEPHVSCSFCNKHKEQVSKLIVSDAVAICNECVSLCQELLIDPAPETSTKHPKLDPIGIKNFLDLHVVGQEQAKIVLSVAVVNHFKRLHGMDKDIKIDKSNILLIGPTGSGKTLLARTLARYLDIPFVIADATSITEAGYVGDDAEMMISRLYAASGNDISKTQRGIVFIDEIDKIARKGESASITRDVSGEGVQQALLKLVEGTVCRFTGSGNRKHPNGDMIEVDTTNILFIAGGAFVGLDKIVSQRVQGSSMGFTNQVRSNNNTDHVPITADDLVKFGMIPEFVGRFPSTVSLQPLTRQNLVDILTSVKNNLISQYQWLLHQDDLELEITPEAIEAIVDLAMQNQTGARSLQSEFEAVMMPHMYNARRYREHGIDRLCLDQQLVNTPTNILERI